MIVAIIIAVTVLGSVAMICFKGITFHKKMEIVPTREPTQIVRPPEMDEIENKLNRVDKINAANNVGDKPTEIKSETVSAMDGVLKALQEVFGPEESNE